jgi:TolB-like protein
VEALGLLGHAYALAGHREKALEQLARLADLRKQQYVPSYPSAVVHVGLGDTDKAFDWLEKAYQERGSFPAYLNVYVGLDPVRDDPRFDDLLRRIGLKPDAQPKSTKDQGVSKPPSDRIRLAVLPFENLGPAEDEYFADGISDEIRSRLAAVRKLGVISRASAFQCKHIRDQRGQVASELNVDYLIDGTIRWNRHEEGADRVRITPELIRVSDEMVLWSQPYDG